MNAIFRIKIKNEIYIMLGLLAVLALGFFLRIHNLSDNPNGLFADEASIAYNAQSILLTGKDEYGTGYPILFRSFGDWRPGLSIYSAIPFVAIFGLNELGARLPSVFFGLVAAVAIYFIGRELGSKSLGLLSAFVAATMPWFIHYNRTGFEFTIYNTFFLLTVLFFMKASQNKFFIIPAFLTAGLSLYTYQPARLIIPLLIIGSLLIYKKELSEHQKHVGMGAFLFLILATPMAVGFLTGTATARFNLISIFSAGLGPVETFFLFTKNYLTQLSPGYMITGEPTLVTRSFSGGLAPLLAVTYPFILIGAWRIITTIKNKSSQLLILWLMIYPLAGALTALPPFTSRSIIGSGLAAILAGLGMVSAIEYGKEYLGKYLISLTIIILIVINLITFSGFYFIEYPRISADLWGWQYGAKNIVHSLLPRSDKYDDLIITSEIDGAQIFFKFYSPEDCNKCSAGLPHDLYTPGQNQIFALTPSYMEKHPEFIYKLIEKIFYPDGTMAYILSTIIKRTE